MHIPNIRLGLSCLMAIALLACGGDGDGGDNNTAGGGAPTPSDTVPDEFFFVDQTDMGLDAEVTSNSVTIMGINADTSISIVDGEYSIDGAEFTSSSGTVANGQSVAVRLLSSASFSTTVEAVLTVGGITARFSVTTLVADSQPDAFGFTDLINIGLNATAVSNSITITGLNTGASISIVGGEYSIDGNAFTAVGGTVNSGQLVSLRQTSSNSFSTTTDAVLMVGGISDTFSVTTIAADTTPDAFNFVDLTGADLNTQYISNHIIVSGLNTVSPVTVVGGEYSIDGGAYTADAAVIANGQSLSVRQSSSDAFNTTTNAELSIGGIRDTFSVTTLAEDVVPGAFSFTDQVNVPRNSQILSNSIIVSDINSNTAISITGGEYSIDGASYTSLPGTVVNGQSVVVRQTSSSEFSTTTNAILTIGGFSDEFSVTTLEEDTRPETFTFDDQTDVAVDSPILSNMITVSGINSNAEISVIGGEYSIEGTPYTSAAGTVANGQGVRVRQTSSSSFSTTTDMTLSIGGVSDVFSVTTVSVDTTPEPFSFEDQVDVALSTQLVSNDIIVLGINSDAAISVSGGEYSIDGADFTALAGTVSNGQSVSLRQTSSSNFLTTTDTALTIGAVSDTFSVTTEAIDTTPIFVVVENITDVDVNIPVDSGHVFFYGANAPMQISVSVGGEYSINNGSFTSDNGIVSQGETVKLRLYSSINYSTTENMTVTIGGVSAVFNVVTKPAPQAPLSCTAPAEPFVVFNGDLNTKDMGELYRAGLSGSGVIRLSGDMQAQGDVRAFQSALVGGEIIDVISPNNLYAAYIADQDTDGVSELYVACTDGSGSIKVSGSMVAGGDVKSYKWSPDSSYIAYRATKNDKEYHNIYTSDPRTGETTLVSKHRTLYGDVDGAKTYNGRTESYRVAPDGSNIAYTVHTQLHVATPDGTSNIRISGVENNKVIGIVLPDFEWSPDSQYIAYRSENSSLIELYVATADGSVYRKVSGEMVSGGGVARRLSFFPAFLWAPNSTYIAYSADQDTDGIFELYTATPDGLNNSKVSLVPMSINSLGSFAWSPSSSYISYAAGQGGNGVPINVFVTDPDGNSNTQVSNATSLSNGAYGGSWRPGFDQLIYGADEEDEGTRKIYLVSADGSGKKILATAPAGTRFWGASRWSSDGSRVVYGIDTTNKSGTGPNVVYSALPDGSGGVQISGALLPGSKLLDDNYRWAADNSRIVYMADQDVRYRQEIYSSTPESANNNIKISGTVPLGSRIYLWFDLSN